MKSIVRRHGVSLQPAFLQAMEEGYVAANRVNQPLSNLFMVIVTQKPINFDSTNPLPEEWLSVRVRAVKLYMKLNVAALLQE